MRVRGYRGSWRLSKYEEASHYDLEATVAMNVETAPVSQRILTEIRRFKASLRLAEYLYSFRSWNVHDLPLVEKSKHFFIVELSIHIQTFSEQTFFLKTKFS